MTWDVRYDQWKEWAARVNSGITEFGMDEDKGYIKYNISSIFAIFLPISTFQLPQSESSSQSEMSRSRKFLWEWDPQGKVLLSRNPSVF